MKFIDTSDPNIPSELRKLATQLNHVIRDNQEQIEEIYHFGDVLGLHISEPMSCIGYLPAPDNKWLLGWDAEGIGPSYGYEADTGDWFKRESWSGADTTVDDGYQRVLAEFTCALLG